MKYGIFEDIAIAYEKISGAIGNIFSGKPQYKDCTTVEEIEMRFRIDRNHCSPEMLELLRANEGVGYHGRSGKVNAIAAGAESRTSKEMR